MSQVVAVSVFSIIFAIALVCSFFCGLREPGVKSKRKARVKK